MLKIADLANRADFAIGPLSVSPARRRVQGPGGSIHVEPIVMKVFLLLLDGAGSVVTRDELFSSAWGGVFVGDDSLNRAIARVRKIAVEVAPGFFEIETVPRTGYRLTGPIVDELEGEAQAWPEQSARWPSRRSLIIGGSAAAALGASGLYWGLASRADGQVKALLNQARTAMYRGDDEGASVEGTLQQAVSLRPDNADALGLLALVQATAGVGQPGAAQSNLDTARENARRALAMDPDQPNALLAVYELDSATMDWFARDQRLRQIIAKDLAQVPAIAELVALLQSAGLNRESWTWNERAIAIEPMSRETQARRAMKLWIAGRYDQADKVIDRARDLWPDSPFVWWVRFLILATTGRAVAAKAMLDSGPKLRPPPWVAMWRACLPALIEPNPANLASARQACAQGATSAPVLAIQSVMILAALHQVDAAFDICEGFLLWRGSLVRAGDNRVRQLGSDSGWRMHVQWLFTPPAADLRRDKRFLPLCDAIGLVEYWKRREVRPDYMRIETA